MFEVNHYKPDELDKSSYERFILAGTVGAMKTTMCIMGVKGSTQFDRICSYIYTTSEIDNIIPIINESLANIHVTYGIEISRGIFAVSGPVSRHRRHIKLSDGSLDVEENKILTETMLTRVKLLNNFEAISFGIDCIDKEKQLIKIKHEGSEDANTTEFASKAVIGAGHGLGMSIMYYDMNKRLHQPIASEGGHITFSAQDNDEIAYIDYLRDLHGDGWLPDYEFVASGKGIVSLYKYIRSTKQFHSSDIIDHIENLDEEHIVEGIIAHRNDDLVCKKTINMFIRAFARVARDLALISDCYSGLFLVGHYASALQKELQAEFSKHFTDHHNKNDMLQKIPVYLVTEEHLAELGCANVATSFLTSI